MAARVQDQAIEPVEIMVNGATVVTCAPHLKALLEELGYGDQRVATALGGEFVAAKDRAESSLGPGDQVEIVAPRQGG